MRGLSLFSGIGGFELGFQQAKVPIEWIGFSEIDPFAASIYQFHFSHHNYGDIRSINAANLPDFDVLVGGFPCQPYSALGKRKGLSDDRGQLFFDIVRILRDKKPEFFLLENVTGLLSHTKGHTFRVIVESLTELGYKLEWQVCNSQNFGVPQHRTRVFFFGHFGGAPRPQVFPLRGTGTRTSAGKHLPPYQEVIMPSQRNLRPSTRRFRPAGVPALCLTGGKPNGIFAGTSIRYFTPRECERLQGFPDDWTRLGIRDGELVHISDTRRYKALGNAVTVNVVQAISEKWYRVRTKKSLQKEERASSIMRS